MKKKNYYGVCAILLISICLFSGCKRKETVLFTEVEEKPVCQTENETQREAAEEEERMLLVHICGAVTSPGVYELAENSRFFHAVEAAGGFTQEADAEYLNMAQVLTDGIKIYIPTIEESLSMHAEGEADNRIDINTASESELCNLPGIGEAKAQSILAYREQIGKYQSIEEIMNVEGIKEGLFEKIKDSIKVS